MGNFADNIQDLINRKKAEIVELEENISELEDVEDEVTGTITAAAGYLHSLISDQIEETIEEVHNIFDRCGVSEDDINTVTMVTDGVQDELDYMGRW